jgi:hypothetical protein
MNFTPLEELQKIFNLTPAEINKVLYHRNNMAKPGVDEQGNPVTIYSSGIQIPEGPNKGKFVSVPGYVNGKIITNDDELWNIWKKDIEKGTYPIYKSSDELNKRDQEIHKIMDMDMGLMQPSFKYANPFSNSLDHGFYRFKE